MTTHRIQILGRYYTLKGIDDKEYIDELAGFVDETMRKIADATGTVDTQKTAILAAMTIADQLFQIRKDLGQDDTELERNINALCDQISMVLEITQTRPSLS